MWAQGLGWSQSDSDISFLSMRELIVLPSPSAHPWTPLTSEGEGNYYNESVGAIPKDQALWLGWSGGLSLRLTSPRDVTLNESPIAPSGIIHYTVKFQFIPSQCNYWPTAGAFNSPKWEPQTVALIQSNHSTRAVFVLKQRSWHTHRWLLPQGLREKARVSFSPWLLLFMNTIMAPSIFIALSQTLISHAAILIFFIKH